MKNPDNDLQPLSRRKAIGALGALTAICALGTSVLFGCGGGSGTGNNTSTETDSTTDTSASTDTASSSTSSTSSTDTAGSCTLIPEETEGPYPLLSVLSNSAMIRSDITEGKTGISLTIILSLVNVNNNCEPVANASVYIWHCDKDGVYSGYSQPGGVNTVGETFLRGIQDVDSNGQLTFTTVYPGWYAGRITHVHFQVYLYNGSIATATSQIAFPQDVTTAVYDSPLYLAHGQNTSVTSFAADNVFSDGTSYQMATITGDTSNGFIATLQVGIAV